MAHTDLKLYYAKIHLEELRAYHNVGGNDPWENAHQDSFFYQLNGAVAALKASITRAVRRKRTEEASRARDYFNKLSDESTSWLTQLTAWRNHGAHQGRVTKMVQFSTSSRPDNQFMDSKTAQLQQIYPGLGCLELLERLTHDVEDLINHCRSIDPQL